MAIRPPEDGDLRTVADHYRLGLSEADLASFKPFVTGLLGELGRRRGALRADRPGRARARLAAAGRRRQPARRVVRDTEIVGEGGDGPLAGRTVAIKDNTDGRRRADDERLEDARGLRPGPATPRSSPGCSPPARRSRARRCARTCASPAAATPSAPGPVRNPWDPTRSAGGSSCGSAALVAAGAVDLATGGDQGGSVRIPSAYSGTVGHKPTYGLVPYTGAFPIELTIDHLGPITRTVADAALMLGVIAGRRRPRPAPAARRPSSRTTSARWPAARPRAADRRRRRGLRPSRTPTRASTTRCARPSRRLRGAGAAVEEVSVPWHLDGAQIWNVIATEGATAQMVDGNAYGMNYKGLYDPELIEHYGHQWRSDPAQFSETVKLVLLAGRYAIDALPRAALRDGPQPRAYELRAAYDDALARYDVLVMPTLPLTATAIPADDAPREEVHRAGAGDDRQHRAVRRDRAPGDVGAGRAGRRAAGRADDHRPPLRRRHVPARGPRLRAGRRRLPVPPPAATVGSRHERRPRPRRHGRPRPGRRRGERAGLPLRVGEGGVRRCSRSRSRAGFFGVDQFRYGIEQMHPAEYLLLALLRALGAHRRALRHRPGALDPDEIERRTQHYLENPDEPLPDTKNPDLSPSSTPRSSTACRPRAGIRRRRQFAVGDRVRVIDDSPLGHTRKARYVRGKTGEIVLAHGTFIYPDSAGNGHGDDPQHVYTVRSTPRTLWGDDTATRTPRLLRRLGALPRASSRETDTDDDAPSPLRPRGTSAHARRRSPPGSRRSSRS